MPDEISPAPTEARGFTPEQMIACDACARLSPPTRMNCLYCGAVLPVDETTAALRLPTLRPLETWEQGFNVILLPGAAATLDLSSTLLAEAARVLRRTEAPQQLREMIEARVELPLARAATRDDASLIENRLGVLGLRTEILADDILAVETQPPKRIRKLELLDDVLTGWTSVDGAAERVEWTKIILFVRGRIFTKRLEVEERYGRIGAESEIADTRQLVADELVLDIYATEGVVSGWRIAAESFDFSCLGERKGLLAGENFGSLAQTLRERAPRALFDDEYQRVRHLLTAAWPLTERTESRGLRRERPGKFNTEAVTSMSNEAQFTRYARLRYYYAMRRRNPTPG